MLLALHVYPCPSYRLFLAWTYVQRTSIEEEKSKQYL